MNKEPNKTRIERINTLLLLAFLKNKLEKPDTIRVKIDEDKRVFHIFSKQAIPNSVQFWFLWLLDIGNRWTEHWRGFEAEFILESER